VIQALQKIHHLEVSLLPRLIQEINSREALEIKKHIRNG
jgi:hypothetical protein